MFAEVASQLEADRNATGIMKELFKGFPESVMKVAVVEPKPVDSEENRIQLQYTIDISLDREKYNAFVDRIIPKLEKLAIRQGEWDLTAEEDDERKLDNPPPGVAPLYHLPGLLRVRYSQVGTALDPSLIAAKTMWELDKINFKTQMVVVVNTVRNDRGDRTTWRWFHVARPEMTEPKLSVKVDFLDRNSNVVTRDTISPLLFPAWASPSSTHAAFPLYDCFSFGFPKLADGRFPPTKQEEALGRKPALAIISPDLHFDGGGCAGDISAFICFYGPRMTLSRKVSVTPNELGRIAKIRCSISAQ
jgi:hypothetical protein